MQELEKHSLVKDLPEHHHTIRHLKMNDSHFAKLFTAYHALESEVHDLESRNTPVKDDYIESLKVKRVHLKDELLNIIQKTEQAL
ncbi:MAG: DUF465 domain-containing protein [Alteromonadaceae bacterium]|jgi:uncharacterized protein YdcH (DUF465 family)|uniref:DUF465 domain-containing protein n=1 Tax=Paraglaciecola mesophila TaxID=197222 RepID=A0ABU9SWL0_9ALTE|nr:DUF465 domain-containing protein [Paraglaciecola sp. T6c]ABG42288.1 protein of unknown function DUF465 [Paraglaciecola sp. T6c]MAD16972.1 DUF465 domain-containing protein [Alteromonadaceae bacterium]MBB17979.1 DUF465 domain-containing protein [Rickettsiales bacterium]|tara:strand:- start:508 stop:762 length:255 start_codon:yes stop_codon:yes gene_type:complete